MKNIIIVVLLVALAATVVNDVARYGKARYDLNTIAMEAADIVATQRNQTRDSNARDAARFAAEQGATVYLYDQDDVRVHVWVQMPVEGTWVLGPIVAVLSGNDIDSPYYIQTDHTTVFR